MSDDESALQELVERAKGMGLSRWADIYGETEADLAVRYLRARKGKVADALAMLEADMKWRDSENIDNITSKSVKEITGLDEAVTQSYLPTWIQGFDKLGRPVLYTAYGNLEVDTLMKKGTTVEKLLLLHTYYLEK
jgi:hypothetical protein